MNRIELAFGNVTDKRITTENDFVSHMIEHIAWRLGCAVDLEWAGDDWSALGLALGQRIGGFKAYADSAAAMGMLDDGSGEALVELKEPPGVEISAGVSVDLDWFLSLRCEQLTSGQPLVDLLNGLAQGLEARLSVRICNHDDTHHTWEGAFRALGTALSRIYAPPAELGPVPDDRETGPDLGDIKILSRSSQAAEISRGTAESGIRGRVDFDAPGQLAFTYQGPPIEYYQATGALESFEELLRGLTRAAGFSAELVFTAKALSSGHVLLEDSGQALGRALREVLVKRMMGRGINGGGDSFGSAEDFHTRPIRAAISVEGRKFWRFVPLDQAWLNLKKDLVIGRTIMNGLYTEDLDDFIDGFSWGLGCSLVIHLREFLSAEEAWPMIFRELGLALKQVFAFNPYRRGVPPGVKANLS